MTKKFQKLEFCNDMFKRIFEVEMHLVRLNRRKYLFRLKNLSSLCYFSFVISNCWIVSDSHLLVVFLKQCMQRMQVKQSYKLIEEFTCSVLLGLTVLHHYRTVL